MNLQQLRVQKGDRNRIRGYKPGHFSFTASHFSVRFTGRMLLSLQTPTCIHSSPRLPLTCPLPASSLHCPCSVQKLHSYWGDHHGLLRGLPVSTLPPPQLGCPPSRVTSPYLNKSDNTWINLIMTLNPYLLKTSQWHPFAFQIK